MLDLNILKLSEHTTPEIKQALARCQNFIAEKPPGTPATAEHWKAVENRLKLQRELVVRGEADDTTVPLPADRLPILMIDNTDEH